MKVAPYSSKAEMPESYNQYNEPQDYPTTPPPDYPVHDGDMTESSNKAALPPLPDDEEEKERKRREKKERKEKKRRKKKHRRDREDGEEEHRRHRHFQNEGYSGAPETGDSINVNDNTDRKRLIKEDLNIPVVSSSGHAAHVVLTRDNSESDADIWAMSTGTQNTSLTTEL